MEDDLVLNLASNDAGPSSGRVSHVKKGGKWTDRLKANRAAKRKAKHPPVIQDDEPVAPPKKRQRLAPREDDEPERERISAPSRPTQIISSLFTYNPKVDKPESTRGPKAVGKPSNAPLDSSTFEGLGLDPLLIQHLTTKMGVTKPTSIQRAALPVLLPEYNPSSGPLRDVFIQSQTGSGKTFSFLLPIIQDLLPLSSLSYIDRSIGTLAIIIVPTRELASQISEVLEALLKLRLRPVNDTGEDSTAPRLTRWLTSGLLIGGSTRTHEKAKLRKGLPILVATPGRLLDHLQKTSSFNVGKCRWLVLDEADRLMELGFEDTIKGIIQGLDSRRKLAIQAVKEGKSVEVGGWDWERQRRTILCSATIREDVQKLAGTALKNPIVIKALESRTLHEPSEHGDARGELTASSSTNFTPPSQLSQKYIIAPLKLRLVTLVSLLRSILSQSHGRTTKILVFLSCTDSVDFHWNLFGSASMGGDSAGTDQDSSSGDEEAEEGSEDDEGDKKTRSNEGKIAVTSPLLPSTSVYRLHGSLPQPTRLASIKGFSSAKSKDKKSPTSAILLCTSVASRGLDLPFVKAVIQYDLPTEGGATEYVHRVGRTARAGKGGEAWCFVAPSEKSWVEWVEGKMRNTEGGDGEEKGKIQLESVAVDTVLKKGFGGKGTEHEERATEVQLAFERWVLKGKNVELARKAFTSHMRAYATHPSDEKHIFHVRHLHIGHLAKSFALREAPGVITNRSSHPSKQKPAQNWKDKKKSKSATSTRVSKGVREKDWNEEHDKDAESRMREAVRAQGRISKKKGVLMSYGGTEEFQVAPAAVLEKLSDGKI
ncbi:P-loop containing nucleoside triphosphate hydrolase protein [Thelephora terrestris]|uniref:ATP-dependent RNA helicase n=1 Tax=Thelephora terrestris TaxID=56493 RepID=A0A9P6HRG8_9AGAM|nr:P-loop containing nucleoside triphosphate hydrolase protein [Thelephora terrestris]